MERESQMQELEMLAAELSDVKNAVRELSRQVLRIERRVHAALPQENRPVKPARRTKLDDGAVRRTIDSLKEKAIEGTPIEDELRRMTVKSELAVIASELGLTNTKLPPKDGLVRLIATRIRQSAIVARGFRSAYEEKEARPR